MVSFKSFVNEVNAAGAGGVFGSGSANSSAPAIGNSDFYAPGDARTPKILGMYSRSGKIKSRTKRKKSK